jgi:hypothetical protein
LIGNSTALGQHQMMTEKNFTGKDDEYVVGIRQRAFCERRLLLFRSAKQSVT